MKKNTSYNEYRLYNNFENINNWINNCDNKASIMLGFIGIIASILLTNNNFITIFIKMLNKVVENIDFSDVLYLIFIFSAIGFILYGTFNIFKVICPTLQRSDSKNKSLIYYDSISRMDLVDYKNSIFEANENDYLEDLLSQVYINSKICSKKFMNLKNGLYFIVFGLVLFFIIFVAGIIVYL